MIVCTLLICCALPPSVPASSIQSCPRHRHRSDGQAPQEGRKEGRKEDGSAGRKRKRRSVLSRRLARIVPIPSIRLGAGSSHRSTFPTSLSALAQLSHPLPSFVHTPRLPIVHVPCFRLSLLASQVFPSSPGVLPCEAVLTPYSVLPTPYFVLLRPRLPSPVPTPTNRTDRPRPPSAPRCLPVAVPALPAPMAATTRTGRPSRSSTTSGKTPDELSV